MLDHETARRDERGDFGIAELPQQAPDRAIERLFPHFPPRIEITAHECRIDPHVGRCGIQRDQTTLAVSGNTDPPTGSATLF